MNFPKKVNGCRNTIVNPNANASPRAKDRFGSVMVAKKCPKATYADSMRRRDFQGNRRMVVVMINPMSWKKMTKVTLSYGTARSTT